MLITHQGPKKGPALLVETTAQSLYDNPESIDGQMEVFEAQLRERHPGDGPTAEYKRAKRMQQAVWAALGASICELALPAMTAHHQEHQTLMPQSQTMRIFPYLTAGVYENMRRPAKDHMLRFKQSAFIFEDAAKRVVSQMEAESHQLYPHFEAVTENHSRTLAIWKETPAGERRRPVVVPQYNSPKSIDKYIGAFCHNILFALKYTTGKGVHHLVHTDPNASAEDLDHAVTEAIPHISWLTSTDRHLGARDPDPNRDRYIETAPTDAIEVFLQKNITKITKPSKYYASATGVAMMRDPDYCPHQSVGHGPIETAAACTGDVRILYKDPADQQAASDFYEHMGFSRENGEHPFSLGAVVLAMSRRLFVDEILPEYITNRERTA